MNAEQLHTLEGWFALAIVLVAMVEFAPGASRPIQWTLALVALYLVLTHVDQWGHVVDQLVAHLGGGEAYFGRTSSGHFGKGG